MTDTQAKRMVVGCMAATGVIASARDMTGGRVPRLRIFVGVLVAGVVLAMAAEAAPDLAGAFALLILTTAIFTAGIGPFNAAQRFLGGNDA